MLADDEPTIQSINQGGKARLSMKRGESRFRLQAHEIDDIGMTPAATLGLLEQAQASCAVTVSRFHSGCGDLEGKWHLAPAGDRRDQRVGLSD